MSSEFEPPPRTWNFLAITGGIVSAIAIIIGLKFISNRLSETATFPYLNQADSPSTDAKLDAEDAKIVAIDAASFELPGNPVTSQNLQTTTPYVPTEPGELTSEQLKIAQTAWLYFQNNWNQETGLVNSVDNFPSVTMWDQAAGMAALVSAYELEIISEAEFSEKMTQALETLANLPLYNDELPNKVYNAQTLIPVDYGELETEAEIGWSAIDLGRIALWLKIIAARYPEFTESAEAVWDSWETDRLTDEGEMYGTSVVAGKEQYNQEGRLGYGNYAAYGLKLWGLDVEAALNATKNAEFVNLYGIGVPYDKRDSETSGANNYVLTEPYILDGIETGFSGLPKAYADRILEAQEARYLATGELTAITEDNLDREPYFVYNSLFVNGKPWSTITDTGKSYNHLTFLSAKASIGLDSLYKTDYTEKLVDFVQENLKVDKGWYNGYYSYLNEPNTALTANNNGVILEGILYEKVGQPLIVWAGVEIEE